MTPSTEHSTSEETGELLAPAQKESPAKAPVVGVFDSGVGGLTIARAIVEKMPSVTLRYFADSVHLPYGNKSPKNIVTYTLESVKFLEDKGIDFLVVACNTATAVALPTLREHFPRLKIIGVIRPGAKRAQAMTKTKKIAVIGTLRTITSNTYKKELLLLDPTLTIHQKACPLLVPLVEEGWQNPVVLRTVLHDYLDPFIASVDVLVLGCTHYPLIQNEIQALFPHLIIIDSPAAVVHEMEEMAWLPSIPSRDVSASENPITFYTNDLNETLVRLAHQFFTKPNIILV